MSVSNNSCNFYFELLLNIISFRGYPVSLTLWGSTENIPLSVMCENLEVAVIKSVCVVITFNPFT